MNEDVKGVDISEVKIGPVVYEVQYKEGLRGHDDLLLDGNIVYSDCLINIASGQHPQHQLVVLWHEILHGILTAAGIELDNNEQVVTALAHGVMGVVVDNPQLMGLMGYQRQEEQG